MKLKIQSMHDLRAEILAVVRGERKPGANAAKVSFESVAAVMRLLSPENRRLLATIEDRKPVSVAVLARLIGRAEPNVSRTLSKLAAAGL